MAGPLENAKPTAHLTALLKEELKKIDEDTGELKEVLIAKNIVDFATGKKGGGREQLTAIGTVFERVDGKVREEINNNFFTDYPKQDKAVLDKYSIQKKIEGKSEFDFSLPDDLN